MKLYSAQTINEIKDRHNFKLSKSLGQNFLTDKNIIDEIIESSGISSNDLVIEIGPGIGVLTKEALEAAGIKFDHVVSMEVADATIMERMSGRRVCGKCGASYHVVAVPPKTAGVCDVCGGELVVRKDDKPETVQNRLAVYHRETEPLKDFYHERGVLYPVEDMGSVEATSKAILTVLKQDG